MVGDYDTQQKIFEHITVASTVLNNPSTAPAEIDRVLSTGFRYKRPVYIERTDEDLSLIQKMNLIRLWRKLITIQMVSVFWTYG